ncbi:MAG: BtaA family protein [Planctomycetia bacterium]|nr:BtaA family protein [Planctomycetia bacterium]
MSNTLSPWVAEAAKLPVAFAQVREDPRIDKFVVERAGESARVCMVASGGCTAAVLVTLPNVEAIHIVDPNPAQLALTRLKLRLLEAREPDYRLALLGHTPLGGRLRQMKLTEELSILGLPADVFGPTDASHRLAPDFAGRYEQCFTALQAELVAHREELDEVLSLSDQAEQHRRVAPETPLGRALDTALDTAMSLPNLVALFGEGATRNQVEPFSRHFARRIRHCFATLPAASNPFLWQMLGGRYPVNHPADWFALPSPTRMPEDTFRHAFMADALYEHPGEFDVVHLSNILDWLSPEEATATLELAAQALRSEGQVIIRQLNSTLDIPALGPMFAWDAQTAAELHARDRSFFYRALHLGRKR